MQTKFRMSDSGDCRRVVLLLISKIVVADFLTFIDYCRELNVIKTKH